MRRTVRPLRHAAPAPLPVPIRAVKNRPTKEHPLRRADDVARGADLVKLPRSAHPAKLMTDWPPNGALDSRARPAPPTPVWYTKPFLWATLWGLLPRAPRK